MSALIASPPDIEVAGEAATGREAIERTEELSPDDVLLDVRMPVTDGVTAAGPLSERTRVVMLTYADEPETVSGVLRRGASGCLVHGQSNIDTAVENCANGAADNVFTVSATVRCETGTGTGAGGGGGGDGGE